MASAEREPIWGSGGLPPVGSRGKAPGQGFCGRKCDFGLILMHILVVLVNYQQSFTPTQAAKRRLPRRLKCSKTRNRTIKLVMADKFTNFQLMDIKNNHNLQLPTVFQ